MARQAKYVDRKGFLENQVYGTVMTLLSVLTSLIRTPEKKAAGSCVSRKYRDLSGSVTISINLLAVPFIPSVFKYTEPIKIADYRHRYPSC
jgi:hypothetical protein